MKTGKIQAYVTDETKKKLSQQAKDQQCSESYLVASLVNKAMSLITLRPENK